MIMENIIMLDALLATLNGQQREVVEHRSGSILVIAGAGSGKTRVITTRIINLLVRHQVDPHTIVALTFTNKAAAEMKERVATIVNPEQMPIISTFHGYCLQLLRIHGHLLNVPTFTILDSDDQTSLIHAILKRNNVEKQYAAKTIAQQISARKNNLVSENGPTNRLLQEIFVAYEREKIASKLIDFDDLLVYAHRLFQIPTFKTMMQQKICHMLVDEYQDTNLVQHALLKQMVCTTDGNLGIDSLCVVGDEDQSIYAWRGATVKNILNFSAEFSKTRRITIDQNYRSAQQILDIANAIIKNNIDRNPKKLWSGKSGNNRALQIACSSGYQEGDVLASAIKISRTVHKHHSIAVLYRAHYQSRIIEEALIRTSIPYVIIGGVQFYERKEIKDLLAYLRLAINQHDRISCLRIINCPPRGLGQKFEELLIDHWHQQPEGPFNVVIKHLIATQEMSGKKAEALNTVINLIEEIGTLTPCRALETVIKKTEYLSYLTEHFDKQEADARIDNVKELMRAFSHFESTGLGSLEHVVQEISLMQSVSTNEETSDSVVYLMTCHAAKGLEFDVVALSGLEEGIFPSGRSGYTQEQLEEERRLMYVGITRAREWLLLTHAQTRYTYGTMTEQLPSRFLKEIPENLVQRYDASKVSLLYINNELTRWLSPNTSAQIYSTPTQKSHFYR
jgi:DNA helicase II / ATP-dependent DNA helicase PcrA